MCCCLRTFALSALGSRMFFHRYLLLLSPPQEAARTKTAHRDTGLPIRLACFVFLYGLYEHVTCSTFPVFYCLSPLRPQLLQGRYSCLFRSRCIPSIDYSAQHVYVLNSHRHTPSPVVRSTGCGFKSLKNTETIDHEAPVHHFRAPIPGKEASVPSVPAHWILLGRRSFSVFYTRQVSL